METAAQTISEQKLHTLAWYLAELCAGKHLEGRIKFRRVGSGLVHSYDEKWEKPITFRQKHGVIQYKTTANGWSNPKYGDALYLLAGENRNIKGTQIKLTILTSCVPQEETTPAMRG